MKNRHIVALIMCLFLAGCGEGAYKRMTTLSGIYTVYKPEGYDVVCFVDADSSQGGIFCMPLSQSGDPRQKTKK